MEDVHAIIKDVDPSQQAAAITNSFSPISCLPTETLVAVLVLNQHDDDAWWIGEDCSLPSIIVACHVNRRFREVAIDMPSLWSNINFSAKTSLGLLEAHLERSQGCLLDIRIRYIDCDYTIHFVNDLLIRNIHRWGTYSAFNVLYESTPSLTTSLQSNGPLSRVHQIVRFFWK